LTQRKHVFLSFSQFFFTKERKCTTKGKTNAGGLREEFFFWEGGNLHHLAINKKSVANPIRLIIIIIIKKENSTFLYDL
jgi:hypothetical protein